MNQSNYEQALLIAKISDIFSIVEQKNYAKFTPFFNESELYFAQSFIEKNKLDHHLFFGGCMDNTRKMLGVFPDYMTPDTNAFPIVAITLQYPKEYNLTHRDFLGALMALRIKRDAVGDILINEGTCVLYVRESVEQLVMQEMDKVARVGVKRFQGALCKISDEVKFKAISGTVASMRLDCIVSLLGNISREKATIAIQTGIVQINHVVAQSNSIIVRSHDIISIRGVGKFLLTDQVDVTKKGRLFIRAHKYI